MANWGKQREVCRNGPLFCKMQFRAKPEDDIALVVPPGIRCQSSNGDPHAERRLTVAAVVSDLGSDSSYTSSNKAVFITTDL